MSITTKRVSYADPSDGKDLVRLITEYVRLDSGGEARDMSSLPEQLAGIPNAFSVLAYSDPDQTMAIGLINCFFGFSTFAGRPLVNVHDVIVTAEHRGKGVSGVMMAAVERIALAHDCCRVTLEVLADNVPALRAYQKRGFARDPAHPETDTFFLRKTLGAASGDHSV